MPAGGRRGAHALPRPLLWGPAIALVLMLLALGPRPDLAEAMRLPMFWVKAGLPASVAAACWLLLYRLGIRACGRAQPGCGAGAPGAW